jgi:serine/threonine protein kinase
LIFSILSFRLDIIKERRMSLPYHDIGDYGVEMRILGSGANGNVYLYQELKMYKTVAIKKSRISDCIDLYHKIQEISYLLKLKGHSNVIQIDDVIVESVSNMMYIDIVMECGIGSLYHVLYDSSLQDIYKLRTKFRSNFSIIQNIQYQCVLGLSRLHSLNIHHLDVSLGNYIVFLNNDSLTIKLSDYGSCFYNDLNIRKYPCERGAIPYRSLELLISSDEYEISDNHMRTIRGIDLSQVKKEDISEPRVPVDVWALGKVLFEIATWRHPDTSQMNVGFNRNINMYISPQMNEHNTLNGILCNFGLPEANSFQRAYLNSSGNDYYNKSVFNTSVTLKHSNNQTKISTSLSSESDIQKSSTIRSYFEKQLRNTFIFDYRLGDKSKNDIDYYHNKCTQLIDLLCSMFHYEPESRPSTFEILKHPLFIENSPMNDIINEAHQDEDLYQLENVIDLENNIEEDDINKDDNNQELRIPIDYPLRYKIVQSIIQKCQTLKLPYYVKYLIIELIDKHILIKYFLDIQTINTNLFNTEISDQMQHDINCCIYLGIIYYNLHETNPEIEKYLDSNDFNKVDLFNFCKRINWQIQMETIFDRLIKRFISDLKYVDTKFPCLLLQYFRYYIDRLLSMLIFNRSCIDNQFNNIYSYFIIHHMKAEISETERNHILHLSSDSDIDPEYYSIIDTYLEEYKNMIELPNSL